MLSARAKLFAASLLLLGALAVLSACAPAPNAPPPGEPVEWALAIHGGAGTIPRDLDPAVADEYRAALTEALVAGRDILDRGGSALDAVQRVVRLLEDDPHFNAGRGAVFTYDGRHTLDAAIMDGRDLSCGAVASVTDVRNPILLARVVMEESAHVLLAGEGAERFARQHGFDPVSQDYFFTERRHEQWQEWKAEQAAAPASGGSTVGAVALDRQGDLAAATSTGGLTGKRWGRVGDVPLIGAGTYARNETCAVSCTGQGEEYIRNVAAHEVSALMALTDLDLEQAVDEVLRRRLPAGAGGMIAVGPDGAIVLDFTTEGMFRGAADARGRFDVAIWD
jgi:beta-aspartyl-peptidase (threonine type)